MAAKRLLIISNELIADRPAGVPEVVWKQVRDADEVRVVVPALTDRLQSEDQSWCSPPPDRR